MLILAKPPDRELDKKSISKDPNMSITRNMNTSQCGDFDFIDENNSKFGELVEKDIFAPGFDNFSSSWSPGGFEDQSERGDNDCARPRHSMSINDDPSLVSFVNSTIKGMDDDPDFEIVFHNEPLTKMFQQKGLKELHDLLDRRLFVNEDLVKPISLRQVACNRYSDAILSQIYKMDLSLDIDKEAKTASTIIKNTNTASPIADLLKLITF